jgi:hypothetical protein
MNKYFIPMFAAGAIMAAALGLASVANAAPSGPSRAEETVKALEADGYHVIVNRTGAAPLSACSIRSVQPGRTYSTVDSRGGSSPAVTVVSKTVHVDLLC